MTQGKRAVCITGGGFSNKGAEAMVLTVVEAVRKRLPDVEIYVRVRSRDIQRAHDAGLTPVPSDPPKSATTRLKSKIQTAITYYKCLAFIDVGGYQFGDPWGAMLAENKARSLKRQKWFGNLVFFMPQAWGPFSTARISKAVHSIIDDCTLACVRDKTSLQAVEHIVGKNHSKVRFAHDIAWNFQGADLSIGQQLIQEVGLTTNKGSFTVTMTPNLRVYERHQGTGEDNTYIRLLADIVRHLCSRHNAQVILLGHDLKNDSEGSEDDRTLCNYVLLSLDRTAGVAHLDKVFSAAEIKSIIGNCDLLLSSRYHALIAALSQGIPSTVIGWSHKYDELMAEVGLGLNIISFTKPTAEILQDIDSVIARLTESRALIATKVVQLKQSGADALNEVVTAIERRLAK